MYTCTWMIVWFILCLRLPHRYTSMRTMRWYTEERISSPTSLFLGLHSASRMHFFVLFSFNMNFYFFIIIWFFSSSSSLSFRSHRIMADDRNWLTFKKRNNNQISHRSEMTVCVCFRSRFSPRAIDENEQNAMIPQYSFVLSPMPYLHHQHFSFFR